MGTLDSNLEPDAATASGWLKAATAIALTRLTTGESSWRSADTHDGAQTPIGENPLMGGIEEALRIVVHAAQFGLVTTAPGYLAYIPGGGLFATAVADFIGDIFNRFTGLAEAAPALVRLENQVLSWLAAQFGYGTRSLGLFTSGGSLATFAAVVAARNDRLNPSADLRLATAYTSSQAHASVASAFGLAGMRPENLRAVPIDSAFRMRQDLLSNMVCEDRARGLQPFLVIAAAGSTNTGAIDPILAIAKLCADHGLWLHADGAYGGAFVLCEEGRQRLSGIELAHSITFDPHKGMFLPYGTGCLLLRDGIVSPARNKNESYLRDVQPDIAKAPGPSPADFGLELSRPYRGLRLWLPLMLHGAGSFREALTEKLNLATDLYRGLCDLAEAGLPIELVAEPQLTVVPFRLARLAGDSLDQWNVRNAAFLQAINRRGRCFLSSTLLPASDGDAVTLRACVLSYKTHKMQIVHCLEDIQSAAREID